MNTRVPSFIRAALLVVYAWQTASADLPEIQVMQRPDLQSVTSVTISPDGAYLYAAAFNPGNVLTFKRDVTSGKIEYQDLITGEGLNAAVSVNLSADGGHLVASSFGANTVTLMKRDAATGKLAVLDAPFDGDGVGGLKFVIDATFSSDGKFIYTASAGGLGVFEMKNDRMVFLQYDEAGGRLQGVRDATLSPDGKWVYAPAYTSGTLGVFRRDPANGKVELVQIVENDGEKVRGIAGAFRVVASQDGKHVYLSSGRFGGDQAVSAFEVQPDGTLKQFQVLDRTDEEFERFQGGNSLTLSQDGQMLYVVASVCDGLFRLKRDATSGKLTVLGGQQVGDLAQPGSAGVCLSPDGKFLYVADEASSSIVAFRVQ
jgi:6-phosphogluconolactonase (cycloisomerase 2 family)